MTSSVKSEVSISEEDALRARFYRFMARVLAAPADRELLDRLTALEGDDSALGVALSDLAAVARDATVEVVEDEFNQLFIGLTRGELLPYASYYLTGYLHEKPLAELRADMEQLGIERIDGVHEPEDHIAALLEMMAGLIEGDFGAPATVCAQRDFFNRHMKPWASRFFTDLEASPVAALYRPVGTAGRVFLEIETEGFSMVG